MSRRPEPGSPWARHCPDAWPREWLDDRRELPPSFTRPASPHEADLITGRISEAAFLTIRGVAEPVRISAPGSKGKPNPVVRKVLGYRKFFDSLPDLEPPLSPGAISVWCWLWTCERKGRVRCSVRRLATRFRCASSTTTRWLAELRAAGLVHIVRRGQIGRAPTVVRVRARAPRIERERSADRA